MSPLKRYKALWVIGLVAVAVVAAALVVSNRNRVGDASDWVQMAYSGLESAKNQQLSPVEIFQKVSPSVFVVEALGGNRESLDLGSGVAIAPDLLITNCHVVENGSSLRISRARKKWAARLVQALPNHDLCGLRPSQLDLEPVSIRSSSTLETGESVYAIGAPEGLELTFSQGVISALRETDGVHMVQTSAPTSPGSSGGGLFDTEGNLVGITTFQLREGQSLNFAMPGEWVSDVLAHSTNTAGAAGPGVNDSTLESAAWIEIGVEAVNQKNYEVAENALLKATRLQQPDAYRAWYELASVYGSQRHLEAQALALEQAIRLKPNYADAWRELARSYSMQKDFGKAIAAAKQSTELDARDKENWQLLGLIYLGTNSYAKAIEADEQGLRIAPSDETLLAELGMAYGEQGDREQVMRIYTQLKEKDPLAAKVLFNEYIAPRPIASRPR
ncbi:MAG TPA: tetratricopeptide repeat-containing serine protease family protein [Candidatus Acidoferrales bacterium]|nr:tetratricopeptide repeat-containing serine protease family protein [Candidatus Acidoferrales bacterium]